MTENTLPARIIEVASELFAKQGFEQTSMRQIAKASRCTAPAIYLHFKDKEALQFIVVQGAFERLKRALDEATRFGPGALFRLQRLGWAYVEFGLEHPNHYQLMFMQRAHFLTQPLSSAPLNDAVGAADTDSTGADSPTRMSAFDSLRRAVQDVAREEGSLLPEPELLRWCDTLWAGLHGVLALSIAMPGFDRSRTLGAAENFILSITGQLQRHVFTRHS